MKPHPKIRKTMKWGGAVVTVLLVVVWIGSGWFYVAHVGRSRDVYLWHGVIEVSHSWKPINFSYWNYGRHRRTPTFLLWWFERVNNPPQRVFFDVPLWVPALGSLVATALAWRADAVASRRAESCPKCNYDRAGLAAGAVCPECGAAPASSSTT